MKLGEGKKFRERRGLIQLRLLPRPGAPICSTTLTNWWMKLFFCAQNLGGTWEEPWDLRMPAFNWAVSAQCSPSLCCGAILQSLKGPGGHQLLSMLLVGLEGPESPAKFSGSCPHFSEGLSPHPLFANTSRACLDISAAAASEQANLEAYLWCWFHFGSQFLEISQRHLYFLRGASLPNVSLWLSVPSAPEQYSSPFIPECLSLLQSVLAVWLGKSLPLSLTLSFLLSSSFCSFSAPLVLLEPGPPSQEAPFPLQPRLVLGSSGLFLQAFRCVPCHFSLCLCLCFLCRLTFLALPSSLTAQFHFCGKISAAG